MELDSESKKLRVMIGGGTGYIGSALIPVLLEYGYDVSVIDLNWFGNRLPESVPVTKKNLIDCTVEDLEGYDQFIFLAGLSNDPMAEFSPSANFIYNAALPAYLAYIAKKAGVKRYVCASSCSVYGYTVDKAYDEETPVVCHYPYGIAKLQGEEGVVRMADDDFSVVSLRQGTVSGYSPRMRLDLVINAMFKSAMAQGKITVNNPAIWRPIFDMRDVINAYVRAIQAHPSISGVFNVASDNYTVGQLADIVKKEVEELTSQKIGLEIRSIQDSRNYKVRIDRAREALGFQPQYAARDTVHDLYTNLDKFSDFDNPQYYNIETFKQIRIEDIKTDAMRFDPKMEDFKKP